MSKAIDLGGRAALSGIEVNLSNIQPFARTEYAKWANSAVDLVTSQHHDFKAMSRVCEYNQIPYITDVIAINSRTGTDKGALLAGTDTITLRVKFSEKVKATGVSGLNQVPSIALALDTTANVTSANVISTDMNVEREWLTFEYAVPSQERLDQANGLTFTANAFVNNNSTVKGPTLLPAGNAFANVHFDMYITT